MEDEVEGKKHEYSVSGSVEEYFKLVTNARRTTTTYGNLNSCTLGGGGFNTVPRTDWLAAIPYS